MKCSKISNARIHHGSIVGFQIWARSASAVSKAGFVATNFPARGFLSQRVLHISDLSRKRMILGIIFGIPTAIVGVITSCRIIH